MPLLEESIEQVAERIAHGGIAVAVGAAVGVFLRGHQFVVAETEDAGVAVVDEGHRPGAAKAITDLEGSTNLLEGVGVAVLELHLVAVLAALAHLPEQAGAVIDATAATAQTAEPVIAGHLGLAWPEVRAEELIGEPGGDVAFTPAIVPAGAFGHVAGLACAQAEVAAIGLAEIFGEMVRGLLAVHLSRDPDGGAVAVVAGLANRVAHHAGTWVAEASRLGHGRTADQQGQRCSQSQRVSAHGEQIVVVLARP